MSVICDTHVGLIFNIELNWVAALYGFRVLFIMAASSTGEQQNAIDANRYRLFPIFQSSTLLFEVN